MKKTTLILAAALLGPVVWANEEPPPPPPEGQKIQSQERPSQRRQRQMRDFFASLTEKERKELRELQESNPEEARKVMAQQLEKYNQKIRERENFLRSQIQIYQTSDSKEVRDKAYAEIKKMIVSARHQVPSRQKCRLRQGFHPLCALRRHCGILQQQEQGEHRSGLAVNNRSLEFEAR